MDPSKKVPDLNCEVEDLLLEVVDLEQKVPDLRSGGTPQLNPWSDQTGDRKLLKSESVLIKTSDRKLKLDEKWNFWLWL